MKKLSILLILAMFPALCLARHGRGAASAGGGGGGTGPAAPIGGVLITGQAANSISMSWVAAVPGSNPIDHYQIYRNGSAYATTTGITYTDSSATNATVPAYTGPETPYSYTVAAVDTASLSSAQTTQQTYWMYYNGTFAWPGDYNYGGMIPNYMDTAGLPIEGPYDISETLAGAFGGALPYSGTNVPLWYLSGNAFKYMTMAIKVTVSDTFNLMMLNRVDIGDISNSAQHVITSYCTMVVNTWVTCKIPLADYGVGINPITGSISGITMTVTSVGNGVKLTEGGYITGAGIPANTYINALGSGTGGTGTYTLNAAPGVSPGSMTYQRTAIYKINLQDDSGSSSAVFYWDNVGFVTQ